MALAAIALTVAACGPPEGAASRRLVRERVAPVDAGRPPIAAAPESPGAAAPDRAEVAPAPAAEAQVTARPDPARRTRPGRSTALAAAPPPVVKQPPPRPNRASEAPTQPENPGDAPASELAPAPARPRTTVRYPQDFPDPFLFRAGAHWYAVSTQRGMTKVPVIRSTDLVHWEERGDALAQLPPWSRFGSLWAPSVLAVPGGFVLYYTTPDAETGLQCLSHAFSPLPDGPFVDVTSAPFICQTDRGGSIDPSPFRDAEGHPWLTWKSEGTLDGEPTRLWSQRLRDDGRALLGEPAELLRTELSWEGPIIEGPSMVAAAGRYHLFYSGNRWETDAYGTGHAACATPAGPCARSSISPVLRPHASEAGSGGGDVFVDVDGSLKLAYHAWDPTSVGYPTGLRRLRIGAIRLDAAGGATVEPLER